MTEIEKQKAVLTKLKFEFSFVDPKKTDAETEIILGAHDPHENLLVSTLRELKNEVIKESWKGSESRFFTGYDCTLGLPEEWWNIFNIGEMTTYYLERFPTIKEAVIEDYLKEGVFWYYLK